MIKHRSLLAVLVLPAATLGIYGLYWFYRTSDEMIRLTESDENPLAWLIMSLIPVLNVVAIWNQAKAVERLSKQGGAAGFGATFVFVLWVIPPLAMLMIQAELNARAHRTTDQTQELSALSPDREAAGT